MNPIMVDLAMVRQLIYEKKNSEFKPVKLRLKIDLVSYPSRAEGLVNMISGDCLIKKGFRLKRPSFYDHTFSGFRETYICQYI